MQTAVFRPLRRSLALLAAGALLVACSGGGGGGDSAPTVEISVPTIEFGPGANADGALRPVPNGFAFPNFAASSLPANEFGAADMVTMFGDGPTVCASGTGDSCVLTSEAMSWAQMVNDSRQSGHCEGFIVQSLDKFKAKSTPTAADLSTSDDVVQGIIRGFATQFIPETRGESKAWRKKKTADVVAELVSSLKAGPPRYVLGVYGELGGHAILPYAVEFSDAANATIQVYDSNWPGRNRFVSVNVDTGEWSFSFDGPDPANDVGAWTGGNGGMDLSSLDSRIGGTCPFCGDGTKTTETMLTIRATSLDWKVETSRGTVDADTTVDGVDVARVRAGVTGIFDYVVSIDPALVDTTEKDAITVSLPPKSVVYAVTPAGVGRAVAATKSGSVSLTETSISTSDGLEVRLAAGDNVVLATNAETATVTIEKDAVSGTATIGGKTVEATTDDQDPKIALVATGSTIRQQPLVLTPAPETPTELAGAVTATRLPEPGTRQLANITPDAPYVLPVIATTTTSPATTVAAPRTTSANQPSAGGATTTTKPKTTATTTATSTTVPTTTTIGSTGTLAPATTTPPTTASNQPPTISTFQCLDQPGVSQLKLQVTASDPEGPVTILFEETGATKYYIDAPTYSTAADQNPSPNVYYFNGSLGASSSRLIEVKVTVSDGSTTVVQTRTFNKTSMNCTLMG